MDEEKAFSSVSYAIDIEFCNLRICLAATLMPILLSLPHGERAMLHRLLSHRHNEKYGAWKKKIVGSHQYLSIYRSKKVGARFRV